MELSRYKDGFFAIDGTHGFLPVNAPLASLPQRYEQLQIILDDLPTQKADGSAGLLASEGLIEERIKLLPDFSDKVSEETDIFVIQALYRAYAFLSSAYTLAPAHFEYKKSGNYGKANCLLPKQLAKPFCIVAKALEVYPWLDYHYAYSLGNFVKKDDSLGLNWENLEMAVKFSGLPDERGFIMLHVDINEHSPELLSGVFSTLEVLQDTESLSSINDDDVFQLLDKCHSAMKKVNERRKVMWKASRWRHYNDFRVFIMGIKGNEEIFDDGVIYEGVDDTPRQYRGQTGAQDNVIPTMDIFSGVINHYPSNELTHYLMDLRSYRPVCVQRFFEDLRNDVSNLHEEGLVGMLRNRNFNRSLVSLLGIMEEIYLFRNGHWQFVQKYIMSNTKYAKATGGTPIISWIPNQIKAVFSAMDNCIQSIASNYGHSEFIRLKLELPAKKELLENQLEALQKPDFQAEHVYSLNKTYKLEDN